MVRCMFCSLNGIYSNIGLTMYHYATCTWGGGSEKYKATPITPDFLFSHAGRLLSTISTPPAPIKDGKYWYYRIAPNFRGTKFSRIGPLSHATPLAEKF